jgi:hypothetical protein
VLRVLAFLLAAGMVIPGCGDDTSGGAAEPAGMQGSDEPDEDSGKGGGNRFCDAYLDYLSDSTAENLAVVVEAAGDEQVSEYAEVIRSETDVTALLAATLDLDDLARIRCQPEWTAGAQGAGDTAAAAQAFFDAVVAGDRSGARNVASANAIAVFDPWEPVEQDPAVGSPALADVGGESFSVVLGSATVYQCEVEAGVVVACQQAA